MEYIAEIYSLSSKFFADYPHDEYPEITVKKGRPYSCLLIEYIDDIFICIPFRSNVRHQYAYHFKTSARSQRTNSGLDYTKTILIKDNEYLDTVTPAMVDQDEYRETMVNLPRITKEVFSYISEYRDDLNGTCKLHPREWQRRYGCSTLPYFKKFLQNTD
ncbi:type III toxin-antitoxin system TenpIN family toxin [Flintibacter porci]|uniref:type III toxin-antitoxin system TenpIN family toxin n=1 Tax=Flintibacter porci TaxID=3342383 RepID=UPI003F892449